jgi:Uma2 family endonuclease
MATQPVSKVSEEEYLRLDRAAEYKSEYVGGEMFAMSGGTLRHAELSTSWAAELRMKLRGKNCHIYSSDARLRSSASGSYIYADISVVCGKPQLHEGASDILTNPNVVIEVLSPSTADYDRGKKFELYREIASLSEYVLTHTDAPHIEHFVRQADESWIFREYRGLESSIVLPSIDCEVRLADLYAGVFDASA